jgi:hypothetical protein
MTEEQWIAEKQKMERKQEALRNSNKAKRYRRWAKQHIPNNNFGE